MNATENLCNCANLTEEEKLKHLDNIMEDFQKSENNLIQILHITQSIWGYLPINVLKHISKEMKIPLSKITGVVSFYSFFSTQPKGEHTIQVCLGTACYVRGGKKILDKIKDVLNIEIGGTTEDRKFSLTVARCIGACGLAPAITIDGEVLKQVNSNKLNEIIAKYQ
jgi:NADH:ubiquinone oxidoreductase subunit E